MIVWSIREEPLKPRYGAPDGTVTMRTTSPSPAAQIDAAERASIEVTAERFGCGARNESERRACALYLWLLGPTKAQLETDCPCRS